MIEANTRAFRAATLALCLGSAMIFANLHVVQSLLPTFAQQFQLTELEASWSLTITILTLGLSLLVYGPLSDAIGRKPIMVVTMAGAVLTTLALSQVESYTSLLVLRGLQGLFLGGGVCFQQKSTPCGVRGIMPVLCPSTSYPVSGG